MNERIIPYESICGKGDCPYESEQEMILDMAIYSMALLGLKYILEPDSCSTINEDLKNRGVGMAEMLGMYKDGRVILTGTDIRLLYSQTRLT